MRGVGVALALAAAVSGCRREQMATSPGPFRDAPVVLISIDTLRSDHLQLYGYRNGSTPVLDAIGSDGIVFDNVYSHCPLTLPSHASLLTGLLPTRHGVQDNIGFTLDTGDTLAARFKAAGYATGAAVSAYVLRHQTGIARGFDFFDDAIEIAGTGESLSASQRDGRFAVDALASWIDQRPTRKFFAFLHLYEPHTPYTPPPNHRLPNAYDGEIAYADELVGRFLDRLRARNLLDEAIVSVVSDHGEGLNDHGESEHGIFLYREALQVPWILRLPKLAMRGHRISGATGIVTVAPTLLELAGIKSDGMDGGSVSRSLSGSRIDDTTVYAETYYPRLHFGWSDLHSAIDGRYHYIRAPRAELFDLSADREEKRNLAAEQPSTANALSQWLTSNASRPSTPAQVPADVRERLKALGYIGSAAQPASDSALADPKDGIAAFEGLKQVLGLAAEGRDVEAVPRLEAITRANPAMLDAWEALAKSLERIGRARDAIAAFRKVLEIDPLKPETHLALARIYALDRQPALAREHATLAVNRDPAAANETLAELALDAGRPDDAKTYARKSLEADPTRYMTQFLLGVLAQREGRCDEAIPYFRGAIDLKRTDPDAVVRNLHAGLADCLARAGQNAEAEREFKNELSAIPSSPEARVALATLYRSLGRDAEARQTLEGLIASTPNPEAMTYWTVVRAFQTLGDTAAAREWSARARAKFPGDQRFK